MNGVYFLFNRDGDRCLDIQIRLDRTLAVTDQIRFVGFETVQAEPVLLGINRNRPQLEFAGRPQDSNGNFTAIERKKFLHSQINMMEHAAFRSAKPGFSQKSSSPEIYP